MYIQDSGHLQYVCPESAICAISDSTKRVILIFRNIKGRYVQLKGICDFVIFHIADTYVQNGLSAT